MTILFITDSLGFCRDTPERVLYHETYINLLRKKYPNYEIIHMGIGGGTVTNLLEQSEYLKPTNPDIIFIQTGIVDCAPRGVSKFELAFFAKIPFLGKYIIALIKKNIALLSRNRNVTYTSKEKFKQALNKLANKFKNKAIFIIEIMPASTEYENKLPKITRQIKAYNLIINAIHNTTTISSNNFSKDDLMTDYHHLNKKGHHKLFTKIALSIQRINK